MPDGRECRLPMAGQDLLLFLANTKKCDDAADYSRILEQKWLDNKMNENQYSTVSNVGVDRRFDYEIFISYRRQDATHLAKWLRRKIRAFRLPSIIIDQLPPDRKAIYDRKPRVWLDQIYDKPSDDFLTKKVFPALDRSERMIVISTPAIFQAITDRSGNPQPNWVIREIERFIARDSEYALKRPIDLVIGHGGSTTDLPEPLAHLPRIDWIDLSAKPTILNALNDAQAEAALTKLVAGLYRVPAHLLPQLWQEEQRQQRRVWRRIAIAASGAAIVIGGLGLYALEQSRIAQENERMAVENERAAAANLVLAEKNEAIAQDNERRAIEERDNALVTQSLFLADLSRQKQILGDHHTAMLLALHGLPDPGAESPRPMVSQAANALYGAYYAQKEVATLAELGSNIGFIAVVDDGPTIYGTAGGGQLFKYSPSDGLQILFEHDESLGVILAPRQVDYVAAGTEDGMLLLLDKIFDEVVEAIPISDSPIVAIGYLKNYDALAIADEESNVYFLDLIQKKVVADWSIELPDEGFLANLPVSQKIEGLLDSVDGNDLIVGSTDGLIAGYSLSTGDDYVVHDEFSDGTSGVSTWISSLDRSADGLDIAIGWMNGRFSVWSLTESEIVHERRTHATFFGDPQDELGTNNKAGLVDIAISGDKTAVITVDIAGRALVHDLTDKYGKAHGIQLSEGGISDARFLPGHSRMFVTADTIGRLRLWNIDHRLVETQELVVEGIPQTKSIRIPTHSRNIYAFGEDTLFAIDPADKRVSDIHEFPSPIETLWIADDAKLAHVQLDDGRIYSSRDEEAFKEWVQIADADRLGRPSNIHVFDDGKRIFFNSSKYRVNSENVIQGYDIQNEVWDTERNARLFEGSDKAKQFREFIDLGDDDGVMATTYHGEVLWLDRDRLEVADRLRIGRRTIQDIEAFKDAVAIVAEDNGEMTAVLLPNRTIFPMGRTGISNPALAANQDNGTLLAMGESSDESGWTRVSVWFAYSYQSEGGTFSFAFDEPLTDVAYSAVSESYFFVTEEGKIVEWRVPTIEEMLEMAQQDVTRCFDDGELDMYFLRSPGKKAAEHEFWMCDQG